MKTEMGVGGYLSASHRHPHTGALHGHTWEVKAWFPADGADAEATRDMLQALLSRWDHTILPDHLASGEALAEEIARLLAKFGCVEVEVSRQVERIFARTRAV